MSRITLPHARISVVIPVYNAASTFGDCLQALRNSSHPAWECIVVDDGSTDDSLLMAGDWGAILLSTGGRFGPARARNLGVRRATGDIIAFIDSDVAIHPDALRRIAEQFNSDPSLDALMGSYDESPADPGFVSQFKNLMHAYVHHQGKRQASTFWCGCGAVKRSVFFQHGGFDESYLHPSIEDIEFGYRMHSAGRKLLLDPEIQGKHLKAWTLGGLIRTDVFRRGIPWTELILQSRFLPNDLNLSWGHRLSVLLSGLLLLFLCLRWTEGVLICMLAISWLNRDFYRFLASRKGWGFALGSVPLHILYFIYSGVSFVLGAAVHIFHPTRFAVEDLPEWE